MTVRRAALTAAALVGLWAAIVLTSSRWLSGFRPGVEVILTKSLGSQAEVGDIRLSWTGMVLISDVQGEMEGIRFRAPVVSLRILPWTWLVSGKFIEAVSSVGLENPQLQIKHLWDLVPLLSSPGDEAGLKPRTQSLPEVHVKKGEVLLTEIHPDLPVTISGKISDQGGRIRIRTPARSDFEVVFTGVGKEARTRVRIKKFFLSDSHGLIPKRIRPKKMGGFMGGTVELFWQEGVLQSSGTLHLIDGQAAGGRWPLDVREARLDLKVEGQQVSFKKATGKLAGIPFQISGRIGLEKDGDFSLDASSLPFALDDLPGFPHWGTLLKGKIEARLLVYGKPEDPRWQADMYLYEGNLLGSRLQKGRKIMRVTGTLDQATGVLRLEQEGQGYFQAEGDFIRTPEGTVPNIHFQAQDFLLPSIPGLAEGSRLTLSGALEGLHQTLSGKGSLSFESGPLWNKAGYESGLELSGRLSKPQIRLRVHEVDHETTLVTAGGGLILVDDAWVLEHVFLEDAESGVVAFERGKNKILKLTSGSIKFSSIPGLRDLMPGNSGLVSVQGNLRDNFGLVDVSIQIPDSGKEHHTLNIRREGTETVLDFKGFNQALKFHYVHGKSPSAKLNLDGLELSDIEKLFRSTGKNTSVLSGRISGQAVWSSESMAVTLLGSTVAIRGLGQGALLIEGTQEAGRVIFGKGEGQIKGAWDPKGLQTLALNRFFLGGLPWTGDLESESRKSGKAFLINLKSSNLNAEGLYQGPFSVELVGGGPDVLIQDLRWGKAFRAQAKLGSGTLTGALTIEKLALEEVDLLDELAISGYLGGTGTLGGTLAEPSLDGVFTVDHPVLRGVPVDDIKAILKADKNQVSWTGALSKGRGKVSFTGSVDPGSEGAPLSLSVWMADGDFGDLMAFFPAKAFGPFSGKIQDAVIKGSGPWRSARYEGRIIVNAGVIMGAPFDRFDGRFDLEGDRFTLSDIKLNRGQGELSLTDGGFWLGEGDTIDFKGTVEAKDLNLAGVPISGTARIDGNTQGGGIRTTQVEIQSEKISVGKSSFRDLELKVDKKGSRVVLDGTYKNDEGKQPITGIVNILPKGGMVSEQGVVIGGLRIKGRYDPKGVSALEATGRKMEVAMVSPWLPQAWTDSIQGKGNFHIVYKGQADDPLVTMNLNLQQGRLGHLRFTSLIAVAQIRDGVLDVSPAGEASRVVFDEGQSRLLARGRFPLKKESEEQGDLTLVLTDGDLSLLQVFPIVQKASGPLEFTFSLTGTRARPVMSLELEAKDGRMDLDNILPKLKNIQFKYRVVDNVVEAGRFEAQAGRGRFHVQIPLGDNTVTLNQGIPDPLAFDLHTSEGPIEVRVKRVTEGSGTGSLFLSGMDPGDPFTIRGTLDHPIVTGRASIENMSFTWPPLVIPGEGSGYSLKSFEFHMTLSAGKGLNYFRTAMGHTLRPKIIPGQDIRLDGRAQDHSLGALGKLESRSGTFRLGRYNLDITEATLDILPIASGGPVSDSDLMPYMEGRAETILKNVPLDSSSGQKADVRVIIDFRGKLHTVREEDTPLEIMVTSEPPLDPDPEVNKRLLLQYMSFGSIIDRTEVTQLPGSALGTAASLGEDRFNTELESLVNKKILGPITKGTTEIEIDTNIAKNIFKTGEEAGDVPEPSTSSLLDGTSISLSLQAIENVKLSFKAQIERDVESDRDNLLKGLEAEIQINPSAKIEFGIQEEFGPGLGKKILDPKVGFSIFDKFSEQGITDSSDHEPPKITEFTEVRRLPGGIHLQIWTNEPALCTMYLSGSGKEIWRSKERVIKHEVEIKGLQSSESYEYYCRCGDHNGNEDLLGPYRFTTGR